MSTEKVGAMVKRFNNWDDFNETLKRVRATRQGAHVIYLNPNKLDLRFNRAEFNKKRGKWYVELWSMKGKRHERVYIDDACDLEIKVWCGMQYEGPGKSMRLYEELGFELK